MRKRVVLKNFKFVIPHKCRPSQDLLAPALGRPCSRLPDQRNMLGTPVEASHEPHDATFSAAALGHAMARTARVLLSTASGTTTEAGQPSSDVNVASSSGAFAADPLFNSAAAARAAASAAEAVAAMHEAARRCAELKGASVDAAAEAAVCESRVQAAAERKALLEAQLGEVENEASALEVEHEACQKMLEQRQAAQQADERALAEAMAQIDAERTEARRALSEAIRRLTSARGEAQRLEAELAANTRRAHLLSGGGEVQRDESASRVPVECMLIACSVHVDCLFSAC